MNLLNSEKKRLIIAQNNPKQKTLQIKTNLDKQLDEIAKKTMRDYKQVFKKLEKY